MRSIKPDSEIETFFVLAVLPEQSYRFRGGNAVGLFGVRSLGGQPTEPAILRSNNEVFVLSLFHVCVVGSHGVAVFGGEVGRHAGVANWKGHLEDHLPGPGVDRGLCCHIANSD